MIKTLTAASALALIVATGAFAQQPAAPAQQGQPAATTQQQAAADCEVVNAEFDQQIVADPERRAAFQGRMAQDLRLMRNVALRLQEYGQVEACQQVAMAIQEISQHPQQFSGMGPTGAPATAADGAAAPMSWQDRVAQQQAAAVPVSEMGNVMADDLIGADVRGADGSSIGSVDDIVLGQDLASSYIVVTYGGFLGMGQDVSAIPMHVVRVSPEGDAVYVNLTEENLEQAPSFERGDSDWLGNEQWRQENDQFYRG